MYFWVYRTGRWAYNCGGGGGGGAYKRQFTVFMIIKSICSGDTGDIECDFQMLSKHMEVSCPLMYDFLGPNFIHNFGIILNYNKI